MTITIMITIMITTTVMTINENIIYFIRIVKVVRRDCSIMLI